MKKLNFCIWLLMLVAFTFASCIKDSLDGCKGKVSLLFRYVGDGVSDIFPQKIEKVALYVYSVPDNSLVGKYECDKNALSAYQGIDLDLYPGEYKIVCWGNALDETRVDEPGQKIAAPGYFDGAKIATNDALYFSTVGLTVPATLERTEKICDFVSSHIKIQVKLEGFLGALIPGLGIGNQENVCLRMTSLSAFTDFGNLPSDEKTDYYPLLSVMTDDASSLTTKYNVMRFMDQNDIALQLLDTDGEVLQNFSLADFMNKYQITVEGINEVTISILLRAGRLGIEIIDWDVENVDPGFEND